jgi:hypothetical protein
MCILFLGESAPPHRRHPLLGVQIHRRFIPLPFSIENKIWVFKTGIKFVVPFKFMTTIYKSIHEWIFILAFLKYGA